MDEIITWRVLVSLVIILIGIYIFKKNNKGHKIKWVTEINRSKFFVNFCINNFFYFFIISKYSHKIKNGAF